MLTCEVGTQQIWGRIVPNYAETARYLTPPGLESIREFRRRRLLRRAPIGRIALNKVAIPGKIAFEPVLDM